MNITTNNLVIIPSMLPLSFFNVRIKDEHIGRINIGNIDNFF